MGNAPVAAAFPPPAPAVQPAQPPSAEFVRGASAGPRRVVRRRPDRAPAYVAAVVVLAALGVGLGGWGSHWFGLALPAASGRCPVGLTLQGSGASFPSSVVSNWAQEFASASGSYVNYVPAGAGQGIASLTDKLVDFAVTDEGLSPAERSGLVDSVGTYLTLPILGGAVAVVYELPGGLVLNLTGAELASIYLGSIARWDDPTLVVNNPSLAGVDVGITTVHRVDPAGMTYALTTYLTEDDAGWAGAVGASTAPAWPSTPLEEGASGNAQMVKEVQAISGAIGYTDLYDAKAKGLPTAALVNPAGHAVSPNVASVGAAVADVYAANAGSYPAPSGDWANVSWVNGPGASDYPLTTLVYLLVPLDPGRGYTPSLAAADVLVGWINFTLTTGQTFDATAFPFVSPPGALLADARAAVALATYNGDPISVCP